MLFNNERRPQLREQDSTMGLPAISKIIGDEWKKLSEDQRNVSLLPPSDLFVGLERES